MNSIKFYILSFFLINLTGCDSVNSSDIVRDDLYENIKKFIKYSEEEAEEFKNGSADTNIYWVEFFEEDDNDLVVLMQQPYYDSSDTDGYLKIDENFIFFYYSDLMMVTVDKLENELPTGLPNQNSIESGLGYSAPNWAYIITENGLVKTFIGE
ncbi:hypothetical protein [Zobellia laminariae]|uniref:hypothetical protein n=1 Tax=Zobellia laminariae TaxID=248906 RepID=UPI0026F4377A|nr:hypothetical protein [Zobellia laminariae]WKX75883.1 hypothetical protein Q5W13_20175 [Zobellia laminariae]